MHLKAHIRDLPEWYSGYDSKLPMPEAPSEIPRTTTKSSHDLTEDPACLNKDPVQTDT